MAEQIDAFGEQVEHTGGEGTVLRYYTLEYVKQVYHNSEPDYPTYDEIGRSEYMADLQSIVDQYGIKLLEPNSDYFGWSDGYVIREHYVDTGYRIDMAKLERYLNQSRGE